MGFWEHLQYVAQKRTSCYVRQSGTVRGVSFDNLEHLEGNESRSNSRIGSQAIIENNGNWTIY